MKNIERIQKLSVLHCVYQMIISADGSIEKDRDNVAIELVLSELEMNSNDWQRALYLNSHDCFIHLSSLEEQKKEDFKQLLLKVAEMGGSIIFRTSCANSLLQLANVNF